MDFFGSNVKILRSLGVWPRRDDANSYRTYASFQIGLVVTLSVYFTTYPTYRFDNVDTVMEYFIYMTFHAMLTYKVIFWFVNVDGVDAILTLARSDVFENDDASVRIGFRVSKAITLVYNYFAIDTSLFKNVLLFVLDPDFVSTIGYNGGTITTSHLIYYTPFEELSVGAKCAVASTGLFLFAFVCLIFVAIDSFMMAVQIYIIVHIKAFKRSVKAMRDRAAAAGDDDTSIDRRMNTEMRKSVAYLQNILRLVRQFEDINSTMMIGMELPLVLIFCTSLFVVVRNLETEIKFHELGITFICLVYIFVPCFVGSFFHHENSLLLQEIAQVDWPGTDQCFRRGLLISMMRVQKPIHFTIGRVVPLTLNTWMMVKYIEILLKIRYERKSVMFSSLKRNNDGNACKDLQVKSKYKLLYSDNYYYGLIHSVDSHKTNYSLFFIRIYLKNMLNCEIKIAASKKI